jgi:hypothetical protein
VEKREQRKLVDSVRALEPSFFQKQHRADSRPPAPDANTDAGADAPKPDAEGGGASESKASPAVDAEAPSRWASDTAAPAKEAPPGPVGADVPIDLQSPNPTTVPLIPIPQPAPKGGAKEAQGGPQGGVEEPYDNEMAYVADQVRLWKLSVRRNELLRKRWLPKVKGDLEKPLPDSKEDRKDVEQEKHNEEQAFQKLVRRHANLGTLIRNKLVSASYALGDLLGGYL